MVGSIQQYKETQLSARNVLEKVFLQLTVLNSGNMLCRHHSYRFQYDCCQGSAYKDLQYIRSQKVYCQYEPIDHQMWSESMKKHRVSRFKRSIECIVFWHSVSFIWCSQQCFVANPHLWNRFRKEAIARQHTMTLPITLSAITEFECLLHFLSGLERWDVEAQRTTKSKMITLTTECPLRLTFSIQWILSESKWYLLQSARPGQSYESMIMAEMFCFDSFRMEFISLPRDIIFMEFSFGTKLYLILTKNPRWSTKQQVINQQDCQGTYIRGEVWRQVLLFGLPGVYHRVRRAGIVYSPHFLQL